MDRRQTVSPLTHFIFHDPPTTEIYTLSLHDALPICGSGGSTVVVVNDVIAGSAAVVPNGNAGRTPNGTTDRKSTRLNSSHANISYAVFCLKKKRRRHRGTHTSGRTAAAQSPTAQALT